MNLRLLSLFAGVLLAAVLSGCAGVPGPGRPALVVVLVVDGLPQRQMLSLRDQFAPDGFARFLERGAWFSRADHAHAYTVTASGHAAMLTGAYPHRSGIIGNAWRDATGAYVYCAADTTATYIGHRTDPLDGTSPKHLKAQTVGDALRSADPRSKVIAIAGKDRGAVLTAGRTGAAYMYMDESGEFASSTFYMREHPAWVNRFNAGAPADRYFKTEWKALLPEAAYARSLPDRQPWYAPGGALPMKMGASSDDAPGLAFYQSLRSSPFIDALTLDFARAAVAGERLGADDAPDLLVVSLSAHDYINHRWSAESRLSHDHLLQLDRLLEAFFRDLDAAVGAGNYLALLTSDHGFMPAPEHSRAQGLDTGRIQFARTVASLDAGLSRRFGQGRWVLGASGSSLLLDRRLVAQRRLDLDDVAGEARRLLLAEPGYDRAYTRRELLSGSRAGEPFFEAMRRSWHPEISGDVQFTVKPNWMFGSAGTTHGSPHSYDTQVPLLVYGPRWVRPQRVDDPVEIVDIAPTLARLLGVPVPSASEGKQLPLAH